MNVSQHFLLVKYFVSVSVHDYIFNSRITVLFYNERQHDGYENMIWQRLFYQKLMILSMLKNLTQ